MKTLEYAKRDGIPAIEISGWRTNLIESILGNYDLLRAESTRAGYLSALSVLKMMRLPPAYGRTRDTDEFQHVINYCISIIRDA